MVSGVLAKNDQVSCKKLGLSQLKMYKETLKLIYNNPEFKDAYNNESEDTLLKMLSYMEIIRKKSPDLVKESLMDMQNSDNNLEDVDVEDLTRQFINENIKSFRKLSQLPFEFQPPKGSMESLAKLSYRFIISEN
jgi:hypothetical protein